MNLKYFASARFHPVKKKKSQNYQFWVEILIYKFQQKDKFETLVINSN